MATPVQIGYESSLYVNSGTYASPTWTEVALARDVTQPDTINRVDVTSKLSARLGYIAEDYGLAQAGFAFDMLVPAAGETDTAYTTIETARKARTPVDMLAVEGGTLATDGLTATRIVCAIFGGEKSDPLQDASTRAYEMGFVQNSDQDAPEDGTTSGGAFVASS